MIRVHRFDGSQVVINAEQIETIEATPDTVIRLLNGKVFVVRDSVDQLLSRCLQYKRAVFEGLVGHPLGILPSRWASEAEPDTEAPRPAASATDETPR